MKKEIIKTIVYELHPDSAMRSVLDGLCDYRRWCWNQALALWNDLYSIRQIMFDKELKDELHKPKKERHFTKKQSEIMQDNPAPSWRLIRDTMVEEKADWQYQYSAHTLQLAVQDLGKAWQNFFNKSQPDWGKPKFRSKKAPHQGFKSDQSKIKDGILYLERPQGSPVPKENWKGFRLSETPLSDKFGTVSYFRESGKYYAAVPYKLPEYAGLPKAGRNTGVDVNVGHFDYAEGKKNVLPKKLKHLYQKIAHYQRQLARKRKENGRIEGTQSKNYLKTRTKLQICYRKAGSIQKDLMHKFTTELVRNYDRIVIEDLDVKGMLMSRVASKGMHRSMFGTFRKMLEYKCRWYGRELITADKLYPSTQRCAVCGNVKKGDEKITLYGNKKHGTKHNEYVCYNEKCPNYGKTVDRDKNAMLNLLVLAEHPELNKAL